MALTKLGKTLLLALLVIAIVAVSAVAIAASAKETEAAKAAAGRYWVQLVSLVTERYPDLSDQQKALLLKRESDQLLDSIGTSANEGVKLYKVLFAYSWRAGAAAICGVKNIEDVAAIDAALAGVTLPEYHLDRW